LAETLSQSEIEALLASMTAGEGESAASPAAELQRPASEISSGSGSDIRMVDGVVLLPLHKRRRAAAGQALASARFPFATPTTAYEQYDFRRPDKLSKDQMRSLQMLHESFAGYFATSLSAYLRAQVAVSLIFVEQIPYDEYIKTVSESLLNILNVDALGGQSILEVDLAILFSMLDRLLGGKGAAGKVVRDLTDIEKMLAGNIIEMAMTDLKVAWESVLPLEFVVASMETSAQFVQIVPGNDTIILMMFEINIGDFRGAIRLCLPHLLIKPILNRLSAQRWFGSDKKKASATHGKQLALRLNTTSVSCVARLGVSSLTVADLAGLEVGQVLPMQVCSEAPGATGKPKGSLGTVDLLVGDQVKFRGRTGLRGRKLAVQIEQVVAPRVELIAHREQSPLTIGDKK